MGFLPNNNLKITLINLKRSKVDLPYFTSIEGNATDLRQFKNDQFDVVFSNSVIEHLYSWENQVAMAKEVVRVGKHFFVQTPNFGFPVEPHFVFPFFHYLPQTSRIWLTKNYDLGHYPRAKNEQEARRRIEELKLLSIKDMKALFPGAKIYREQVWGLTKSIIAHNFK